MNQEIHPFEKSGLGKAPFRFVFCYSIPPASLAAQNPEAYNAALREMPRGVGVGSCRHCGMCLTHNFIIESADGKRSAVGCECVSKAGQSALQIAVDDEMKKIRRAQERAKVMAAHEVWLGQVGADGKTNRQREEEREAAAAARRKENEELLAAAEKAKADQEARDKAASQHLYAIGQRKEFELIFSHQAVMPGAYGNFYIQTFRTAEGAMVVYKGGTPIWGDRKPVSGDRFLVKATVKAHSEYQGIKQTVISRAKEKA